MIKALKKALEAMSNRRALFITTAISIFLITTWTHNTTAGFNREFDLIDTIIFVVFIIPQASVTIFAVIRLIITRINSEKTITKSATRALSIIMVLFSLANIFILDPGPVGSTIHADTIRPTDDGLFEYRLELVNVFQRNASARLFIRDLSTGDFMLIPVDMINERLGGLAMPARFLWGRMEPSETQGQYIFRVPASRGVTYIDGVRFEHERLAGVVGGAFLIDPEARTASELYRIAEYRTLLRRILDEDERLKYQYFLRLFDTYKDGERTDIEVLLTIGIPEPQRTYDTRFPAYDIPIPIDAELIKNNNLRQWLPGHSVILWITLEPIDFPNQFIARTTADLSEEITLTFLIDIPTLTATRMD